jgi:thiol:disulfide interchange protein DsbD
MKRSVVLFAFVSMALSVLTYAQPSRPEPVFNVELLTDREPVVAGEQLRLAVVLNIDRGWHVNSDDPGDEFSLPTTVTWTLPEGWPEPEMQFPAGEQLQFEFSETPLEVWQGRVVIVGSLVVPRTATGKVDLRAVVTAQACDDTQCLPPVPLKVKTQIEVMAFGTKSAPRNSDSFAVSQGDNTPTDTEGGVGGVDAESRLAGLSFPFLIVTVFLAGLALNLTPCVYPLIPITVGFFAQQAKDRIGGTIGLAVSYVLGMSVTYSVLGVTAALTGRLFGTALQSPVVIGVIVAVLLALAASMFGLWELKVPGWAMRASGGRGGFLGALLMGLVVGFVAAPCIGPFVIGLLTFVGQRGDPLLGFLLFFTLALGLGLPYLVLGTFTGMINRLPASGAWMIGVRKVFGVLLVALAVYFGRSFLPGITGAAVMGLVLILGGVYLLVVDRTGHEQPVVDRFMRLVSVALVIAGVLQLPLVGADVDQHLEWFPYEADSVAAAIDSGQPVILDFYADWCAPCRELDEKTFSDPRVARVLSGYARFKVDQTRSNPIGDQAVLQFEVMGMPTVIVLRDGRELFRITGFEPPEQFLKRLERRGHRGRVHERAGWSRPSREVIQ